MNTQLFIALSLTGLAAFNVQAACLTTAHPYSGIVQPHSTTTAHGPVTVINGSRCRSVIIEATIEKLSTGPVPNMTIERLDGAQWTEIAHAYGRNASFIGAPGTYRVLHRNDTGAPLGYKGSTSITR